MLAKCSNYECQRILLIKTPATITQKKKENETQTITKTMLTIVLQQLLLC